MLTHPDVLLKATLLLEDGTVFYGQGWGFASNVFGELVFNTAHTGYEEVLTDPSYAGQIVVFTTSHIGNTGITETDAESTQCFAEGFVCKDFSEFPDNPKSKTSLLSYLKREKKCAISGIDTRALALHLREKGCLRAVLSVGSQSQIASESNELSLEELKSALELFRQKALPAVLHSSQAEYKGPFIPLKLEELEPLARKASLAKNWTTGPLRVAVIDFGIKKGIAQSLVQEGLIPVFFSPFANISEIEAIQPDGLFLSNGPGDPRDVLKETPLQEVLEALTKRLPTFGICMGHQILALVYGARIRKLKFGHHAVNHPVQEISQDHKGYITSQNHNFVAELQNNCPLEVTLVHLNDGTIAGLKHKTLPISSVQFHPECNPGPRDANGLFSSFASLVHNRRPK
jgi:carbamoyl-phosphate synthase small subunit